MKSYVQETFLIKQGKSRLFNVKFQEKLKLFHFQNNKEIEIV